MNIKPAFVFVLLFVGFLSANHGNAQESEERSPSKHNKKVTADAVLATRQIYSLQAKAYTSGESTGMSQVELLYTWSRRLLVAEMDRGPEATGSNRFKPFNDHIRRMRELEKVARRFAASGQVASVEPLAFKYFSRETDRNIATFERFLRETGGDREMDVQLPSSENEAQALGTVPKELLVNIKSDGSFHLGDKQVDALELERQLKDSLKANPSASVIVRADKRVELQFVVGVMNICKKVGVEYVLTTAQP